MTRTLTAIANGNQLTLSEPLPVAPGTQVTVVVTTPVTSGSQVCSSPDVDALDEFDRVCEEFPINLGGIKYTRDELHERR